MLRFAAGKAAAPLDVTDEGVDVRRPAVAIDGDGTVVLAWSEKVDGNWDLYRRTYRPDTRTWSERARLTNVWD